MAPSTIGVVALTALLGLSSAEGVDTVRGTRAELRCGPIGVSYYSISLAATRNVPGTGLARASAEVGLPQGSPFSIGVSDDGSYVYDLSVSLAGLGRMGRGVLVAWVADPDLSRIQRLGALGEDGRANGRVDQNQFIVVVTLEESDDPSALRWSGPVAFRGMSRSGRMHTMVGHGALQQENCAAWGYGG